MVFPKPNHVNHLQFCQPISETQSDSSYHHKKKTREACRGFAGPAKIARTQHLSGFIAAFVCAANLDISLLYLKVLRPSSDFVVGAIVIEIK